MRAACGRDGHSVARANSQLGLLRRAPRMLLLGTHGSSLPLVTLFLTRRTFSAVPVAPPGPRLRQSHRHHHYHTLRFVARLARDRRLLFPSETLIVQQCLSTLKEE